MKITKNQRIETLEQIAVDQSRAFKIMADRLKSIEVESKWIIHMTGIEKPQLKQLGQSVFDGLDEKWRWAAIDSDGDACLFSNEPEASNCTFMPIKGGCMLIGKGYNASNWQNSLIERDDIAKELAEVDLSSGLTGSDLCRAMLARGDKCVLIRMGGRDDKQARDIGRFAIATSIDESGRFNVMSDQQPISKVDFAVPINNQGEPLTASEVGL